MSESVYVKEVEFAAVEKDIRTVLADIDRGVYDEKLAEAGIIRPVGVKLSDGVDISQRQGMSPDLWGEIIVTFAPLVAAIAKDVWQIVAVPLLKRIFHKDRVSEHNPHRKK
jgi:hypothetical protein